MAKEIVLLIHGVNPRAEGSGSEGDYQKFLEGVQRALDARDAARGDRWRKATTCKVHWGWHEANASPASDHELLQEAQRYTGKSLFGAIDDTRDFTLNPLRMLVNQIRPLIFNGFGDMFYYCSAEGKNVIRQTVGESIRRCMDEDDDELSLTIVGHSAGSVIAADLAFYIFNQKGMKRFIRSAEGAERGSGDDVTEHEAASTNAWIADLKQKVQQGKLRLRRLVTLGSPFSLVLFRNNALVSTLSKPGATLDPLDYGLGTELPHDPLPNGPRWINVWDRDDAISWPVEFLFKQPSLVADLHPDVSDSLSKAHGEFWPSPKVHEIIAERW